MVARVGPDPPVISPSNLHVSGPVCMSVMQRSPVPSFNTDEHLPSSLLPCLPGWPYSKASDIPYSHPSLLAPTLALQPRRHNNESFRPRTQDRHAHNRWRFGRRVERNLYRKRTIGTLLIDAFLTSGTYSHTLLHEKTMIPISCAQKNSKWGSQLIYSLIIPAHI